MQLQNKYLTLKQQSNSSSTKSSLPYSEERIGISSNLLADNVPTAIQRPAAVTVTPVQEPTSVQPATVKTPVQGATVQTPVTIQATPVKGLPPTFILTPPPTVEAPSQRKQKRLRIRFVHYLGEDGGRSRRLSESHHYKYKYSQKEDD